VCECLFVVNHPTSRNLRIDRYTLRRYDGLLPTDELRQQDKTTQQQPSSLVSACLPQPDVRMRPTTTSGYPE